MSCDVSSRKIFRRIVEQEEIEASVAIVVDKNRVRGKPCIGYRVLGSGFGERAVAVVDEEKVCTLGGSRPFGAGYRDVDIEKSVVIDVHHRCAGGPGFRRDASFRGDVLEAHVAFVEVQAAGHHVAREKEIDESIVIDVADSYACAVVDVNVSLNVQRIVGRDGVGERDAGLVRTEEPEQRLTALPVGTACHSNDSQNGQAPRFHPADLASREWVPAEASYARAGPPSSVPTSRPPDLRGSVTS